MNAEEWVFELRQARASLAALMAERNTWARQMADVRDEAQGQLDAAAHRLERTADDLDAGDVITGPLGTADLCRAAAELARAWNRSEVGS